MRIFDPLCDVHHIGRRRDSAYCLPWTPEIPGPTKGRLVMVAAITFAFFALALALPGLVTLVVCGSIDVQ
jgi:hypothetical protein